MIKAVIIEDEKNSRESLKDDLKKYCPEIQVIAEADGVTSGFLVVKELQPGLVFLDIELTDGTGFELLEKLSSENPAKPLPFHVVFTTSHNHFAIKAFKFSAIDYLLKPVDADELVAAIKKISALAPAQKLRENANVLLSNVNQKQKPKIALASGDSILVYPIDEIIRCESQRNYTMFYFKNDKPLLISRTLKEYDELLSGHSFERVHNSHLVNLGAVKKYVKSDGGYLIMEDNSNVPVAQSKKENLIRLLSNL